MVDIIQAGGIVFLGQGVVVRRTAKGESLGETARREEEDEAFPAG